jgi:hypothetical protein
VNAANRRVSYGSHADRPGPDIMPPGALYTETDRTVLYQNRNGAWHYVAGTMWGTLSPDERPADLGVNDGGFDFRATDVAREFLWSQSQWIEVSAVQYGIHSGRPAPTDIFEGAIYVEEDRGGVIYQNQNGAWHYLAGTMYGTLSPDQRPTDLGATDGGFEFRGTDQQQHYIWSQTEWIEPGPWLTVTGGISYTSGNVGIATANPACALDTNGMIRSIGLGAVPSTGIGPELYWDGTFSNLNSYNRGAASFQPLQITGSSIVFNPSSQGSVGIWTTNPTSPLSFGATNANIASRIALFENPGSGNFRGIGMANPSAGLYGIGIYANVTPTNNNYVVFVSDNGQVGIGTTPGFQLQMGLDSAAKPATSTWTVASDARLKQNIEPVSDDSLAILDSLDWIRFEYNGSAQMPKGLKSIGLNAQALRALLPEAVRDFKDKLAEDDAEESELLGIDYHHILVHTARAIQQLSAEIKALKQKQ